MTALDVAGNVAREGINYLPEGGIRTDEGDGDVPLITIGAIAIAIIVVVAVLLLMKRRELTPRPTPAYGLDGRSTVE